MHLVESPMKVSNLLFAHEMAGFGYEVFPCRGFYPNSLDCFCGRHECVNAGYHFKDGDPSEATNSDWDVRNLFGSRPYADVGIKLGSIIYVTNEYVRSKNFAELLELRKRLNDQRLSGDLAELHLSIRNHQFRPPFSAVEWRIRMEEESYVED